MTFLYSIIAVIIIAADQLIKYYTQNAAVLGEKFGEIPYIADFVFVKNTGAAFSMFSGNVSILGIISIVFCISVVVYWIIKRPKHPLLCTSIVLLFSGAAGNAIDRIMNGYVVDFIDLKFMDFPVFNIADIAITVGAVLLVIYVILFDKDNENE